MSTIELKTLTKRFGDFVAVNAVDLFVDAGEVVCLLGPSGCGKTTTLRMIAGLESVTEGDVIVAGRRVNDVPTRERNIAMTFQFYALYPKISVRENLAYPLHANMGASEIAERIAATARMLQLESILNRLPDELSEGEKQRVAVGRSIVREPDCFLFDEPLSRLDVHLRETMRAQIKEVLGGLSKATVIVTHDQLEALTMADRIAVMRDGAIEQIASPHDIFAHPANLFVAGFIGTPQMNLLPARVAGRDSDALWVEAGIGAALNLGHVAGMNDIADGTSVTVGLRPRALVSTGGPADDAISGAVDIIEPMGPEVLLHVKTGEAILRAVIPDDRDWRPGDTVHLRPTADQIHLFGADERVLT